jgi:rSAM/selenodomain-associated transferase 1
VDQNRRVAIYCAPELDDPLFAEAARRAGARLEVQQGAELGARLRHAFEHEHERGARAVAAIGSDSPTLPLHLLDEAFRALAWDRVVLGPTFDGGYWLVGAQRPAPDLFESVPWSTPNVLEKTLAKLRDQSVRARLLPFWYDVDDAADLARLTWHIDSLAADVRPAATWTALQKLSAVAGTTGEKR